MKKLYFIHGGPGLNSEPEKNLLSEIMKNNGFAPHFWNEPKIFQTDNYYQEILDDLESSLIAQDLYLVCHSSGCKNILNILPNIKRKIRGILFISPFFDFDMADQGVLETGLGLIDNDSSSKVVLIKEALDELKNENSEFDSKRVQALSCCLEAGYFSKNFVKEENFVKYFSFLQGENEFRMKDYFKVRATIPKGITYHCQKFEIPLIVLFGDKDPIIKPESVFNVINQYFKKVELIRLPDSAHLAHIENKSDFTFALQRLASF